MKNIIYAPNGGVCTRQIEIVVGDDQKIVSVNFTGGCHGNTQGVAKLVEGMHVDQVVAKLKGIDCKGKGTSCPDQLAKALTENI